MSPIEQKIIDILKCVPLLVDADTLDDGTLRICTPFKYPDGSNVDVFVEFEKGIPGLPELKVSDLGQTFAWLLDVAIRPWKSQRRRVFVQDAIRVLQVVHQDGELLTRISGSDDVGDAVIRVAQAAVRVSDLLYTQRYSRPTAFHDVFEEFLEGRELPYLERIIISTPRREIEIPYSVQGKTADSLVQLLSTKTPGAAHQIAGEAFMRWYDLADLRPKSRRVTIYDDGINVFNSADIGRLVNLSSVVPWSDQSQITEVLAL